MKSAFFLCILSFFLFSCKKTPDPIEKPPVDSKPKEKNLIRLTVTQLNSEKIFWKLEWKYDNSDRCIELTEKRSFPSGVNNTDTLLDLTHYTFYYNNAQTEPYRIFHNLVRDQVTRDAYLTYLPDGKKLKDSTISTHPATGKILTLGTYKYDHEAVYYHFQQSSITWNGPVDRLHPQYEDTVYTTAGNVSELRKSAFGIMNDTLVKYMSRFGYSYDNRVNPFKQQNIASAIYQIGPHLDQLKWFDLYAGYVNFSVIGYNTNNIIKVEDKGFPQNAQTFNYVYDQDNYPKEATTSVNAANGVAKIFYEYNDQ